MSPVDSLRTETKFKKTEIGEIPVDWQVATFGEVSDEIYRYPTYGNIAYMQTGIPEVREELIRSNGAPENDMSIYRYISKETAARFPRTRLIEGDFVISVRGTMGKIAMIPRNLEGANIAANLLRISPKRKIIHSPWLYQVFLSNKFQHELSNTSSSTTIKAIKAPEIRALKLVLPPIAEQRKIADILSSVDETIEKKQAIIEKTKELKKGIMLELLINWSSVPLPSMFEQERIANIMSNIDKKLERELYKESILANIKKGLMERLLTGKIRVNIK
ncbi:MAG: restriction endonuclease subunit S [Candidatus Aminicenantales bacterium]